MINLTELIPIFLASSSLAWIITNGRGFKPLRESITRQCKKRGNFFWVHLDILFGCTYCMGFWTSFVCYFAYMHGGIVGKLFIFGLIGALVSLIIYSLIHYFKDV